MEPETMHASAKRLDQKSIQKQVDSVLNFKNLTTLYSTVSDIVLILNQERQIVFYNNNLLTTIGAKKNDPICGLRLGEAFRCMHAFENKAGCGTTEFCKYCGAVNAMLSSQSGQPDVQECRIIQKETTDALEFRVSTNPITIGDQQYTIAAITDISHEKRRKVLERIFFHDIMNTAIGVRGLSELLKLADEKQLEEFRSMINVSAVKLVDEINSQRELTAAENNELTYEPSEIDSLNLLNEILAVYKMHEVSKKKLLEIDSQSEQIKFNSDKTLISRVIGNMTKNALEACTLGDKIKIGCYKEKNKIKFWVHNPNFMERKIQLQVFQRSFSTKGAGRGLGTYSMKLLSERYLNGKVSFTSSQENGTKFLACYPINLD